MKTFLLLLLVIPLGAWAQGSGSIATPPPVNGSDREPFRVTRAVTGIVQSRDGKSIVVEDAKTKKPVELIVGDAARIRVSGSGIDKLDAIPQGARVRVNYAQDDRRALDIRVLELTAKGGGK